MTFSGKKLLYLLFFLFMASCVGETGKEEAQIKQVIKWYNEALVRVYKDLDLKPLNGLTTENEIGRARMMIWKFKAEKKYMESEQKGLVFKSITMKGPQKADVETSEKWQFRHLRAKTGTIVQPWKKEDYTMYYRLSKIDGKWIIEKARLVREDLDRNSGYMNHSSFMKNPSGQ